MKSVATFLVLVLVLAAGGLSVASAQTQPDAASHAHHAPAPPNQPQLVVPAEAAAATEVAERFSDALSSGDLETVGALLAPDVLILDSGGAASSREAFLGHHAISDANFLKGPHRTLLRRHTRVSH